VEKKKERLGPKKKKAENKSNSFLLVPGYRQAGEAPERVQNQTTGSSQKPPQVGTPTGSENLKKKSKAGKRRQCGRLDEDWGI